jgi:putative aldouronate transport system permease protein
LGRTILKRIKSELPFHLMLIPGIIVVLIFSYGPMFGLVMAFQKFNPYKGFLKSKWIGFDNFKYVFDMPDFKQVLWNTLYISVLKIIFGLVVPLIFALLLNELRKKWFIKIVQTSIFLPFFMSWAILGGIIVELISLQGPINTVISSLGLKQILFLLDNRWFPIVIVISDVWKSMGYNMIIFLAAITVIDISMYEAAEMDGAGRWKQTIHITIPAMTPIIILLATLSIGNLLNAGFEQVLILYNPIVYHSGDIIDTFVYRLGIFNQQFSPAAAVGLFKSGISFILVSISYYSAYRFSDYRIF